MGIELFVGGNAGNVQGEAQILHGLRCFTGAIRLKTRLELSHVTALLDSGAFSDKPSARLTPATSLERQLEWESKANKFCHAEGWKVYALVSYDRLIDETWIGDMRQKRRWSLKAAESAVGETIEAAAYLASHRDYLTPRKLVLAAQGVDSIQYTECAREVLKHATSDDWFGFGGWCIIGRNKRMLPEFQRTITQVMPLVKAAGVKHVHLFGVMWLPALGSLLHVADQYDITMSTDSSAPVLVCTRKDAHRAGVRLPYWRDNVNWWQDVLQSMRWLPEYKAPPDLEINRQIPMFDMEF
jgi:hypothetical protein